MNKTTFAALAALLLGAAPALAHNGVIHEALHGGIMKATKTAHFEILLAPKGGVRIYFMDASGKALPATAASDLSVEIDRPGQKTEYVTMKPDPTSTLWTGNSKPVDDPKSIVRVGSVVQGESELIEIPRSQFPVYGKEAPAKGKPHAH
jgi:hypothetical protein